jgi:Flp pilus assembly protein TadG
MLRKRSAVSCSQSGQALVEFTLMFPIFLAVLIGLVGFSLLFYSYATLQLAVREGTSAIVHDPRNQTTTSIQNLVRSRSFALDPSQLSILVEPTDSSQWISGVQVSVSAVYYVPLPTVSVPMGGRAVFLLGPIPIKAVSIMTIE